MVTSDANNTALLGRFVRRVSESISYPNCWRGPSPNCPSEAQRPRGSHRSLLRSVLQTSRKDDKTARPVHPVPDVASSADLLEIRRHIRYGVRLVDPRGVANQTLTHAAHCAAGVAAIQHDCNTRGISIILCNRRPSSRSLM